jgi:hypothetical protein
LISPLNVHTFQSSRPGPVWNPCRAPGRTGIWMRAKAMTMNQKSLPAPAMMPQGVRSVSHVLLVRA